MGSFKDAEPAWAMDETLSNNPTRPDSPEIAEGLGPARPDRLAQWARPGPARHFSDLFRLFGFFRFFQIFLISQKI